MGLISLRTIQVSDSFFLFVSKIWYANLLLLGQDVLLLCSTIYCLLFLLLKYIITILHGIIFVRFSSGGWVEPIGASLLILESLWLYLHLVVLHFPRDGDFLESLSDGHGLVAFKWWRVLFRDVLCNWWTSISVSMHGLGSGWYVFILLIPVRIMPMDWHHQSKWPSCLGRAQNGFSRNWGCLKETCLFGSSSSNSLPVSSSSSSMKGGDLLIAILFLTIVLLFWPCMLKSSDRLVLI